MIRQLLMVSDDGQPDFEFTAGNNLINWIKDGNVETFALICIIIGALLGLFIAFMIYIIKSSTFIYCCDNCKKDIEEKWNYCPNCGKSLKTTQNNKSEVTNEENCSKNQDDINSKNDSNGCLWIAIILLLAIIALFITGIIAYQTINEGNDIDDIKNAITSDRNAKNNDIDIDFVQVTYYTKADEYIVKIQANEKIKSLIIEIDYLDKNRNILKTEELDIGNITPGNIYTFTINQNGMHPDKIDKTKSFKYRVTKGYVIEE